MAGDGSGRYGNDLRPGIAGCNLPQSNLSHIQAVKERKKERERERERERESMANHDEIVFPVQVIKYNVQIPNY